MPLFGTNQKYERIARDSLRILRYNIKPLTAKGIRELMMERYGYDQNQVPGTNPIGRALSMLDSERLQIQLGGDETLDHTLEGWLLRTYNGL